MPSGFELLVVLVLVLILFGAGRLPQVFEAFGQGLRRFREAQAEDPDAPAPAPGKQLPPPAAKGEAARVVEADEVDKARQSVDG